MRVELKNFNIPTSMVWRLSCALAICGAINNIIKAEYILFILNIILYQQSQYLNNKVLTNTVYMILYKSSILFFNFNFFREKKMKPLNLLVLFVVIMIAGGEPVVQMTFMEESLLKIAVLAIGGVFVFRKELIKLMLLNK